MKRFSPLVLAGVVGLTACVDTPTVPVQMEAPVFSTSTELQIASQQQLVVFHDRTIPSDFAARVEALGGTVHQELHSVGVAFVGGLDVLSAAELSMSQDVMFMEPEVVFPLAEPVVEERLASTDLFSPAAPGQATYHYLQWHHRQIGAPAAWAAGTLGSSSVKVGIIDTGLDYLHRDLAGLVDMQLSRSFLPTEDAVIAQFLPGIHPMFDLQGHGTHVGATVSSNARIAAGVTSGVTLVGLKVCRSGIPGLTASGCPSSAVFAAVTYAADNDLDVVNLSLGGLFTRRGSGGYEEVVNRVFEYAKEKNLTVVVAAGNSNVDLDLNLVPTAVVDENGVATGETIMVRYPSLYGTYCSTPNTICVSATGPASAAHSQLGPWYDIDSRASYSNYGRSAISVAAPGGTGAGAVWAACPTIRIARTGVTSYVGVLDSYCQNYPTGKGGTSMAAPHVAGLAALMVERHGRNPSRVANAIRSSADDIGPRGKDPHFGMGRINVAKALGM